MTIPQFSEMIEEIDADGIVIDPDGGKESLGNQCSISLSREQADSLTVDEIVEFVLDAATLFDAKRHAAAPEHPMVFYCWIDEMAGQLRFCVVSSEPLPFGCVVQIVPELSTIAEQLLECTQLDEISFDQFVVVDDPGPADFVADDEPFILDVFVLKLPQRNYSASKGDSEGS